MPAAFRPRSVLPLAALLAVGCGSGEGVKSYRVPKSTATDRRAAAATEYRILGAVYPAGNPAWFFKFTGSAEQVGAHEADFDALAASVRLQKEPTALPAFTLPEGWKLGGPRSVSRGGVTVNFDQTILLGPADAPLEITISQASGGLLTNADRWARQVGLPGVGKADLDKYTREIAAAGGPGVRIDVRGPANPAGGPMMGRPR